ncbi:hypothetical protein [Leifsonia aquatica]|uniref:Uncharacterized protein n=1 Tax=Leifsonia aquatica TaxID=144185 RepID=A0A7W4UXY3_LEIAQ|nr:hypothetical protein [Leifsonia aquatica]MBB2967982.1 hypothetical protein [Leifsonia aquatica]
MSDENERPPSDSLTTMPGEEEHESVGGAAPGGAPVERTEDAVTNDGAQGGDFSVSVADDELTPSNPPSTGDDTSALTDDELTRKDRAYSPGSDRETEQKQHVDSDVEGVKQLPGTGGPDDAGDVDVPGDHLDPAVIAARSSVKHRQEDA